MIYLCCSVAYEEWEELMMFLVGYSRVEVDLMVRNDDLLMLWKHSKAVKAEKQMMCCCLRPRVRWRHFETTRASRASTVLDRNSCYSCEYPSVISFRPLHCGAEEKQMMCCGPRPRIR